MELAKYHSSCVRQLADAHFICNVSLRLNINFFFEKKWGSGTEYKVVSSEEYCRFRLQLKIIFFCFLKPAIEYFDCQLPTAQDKLVCRNSYNQLYFFLEGKYQNYLSILGSFCNYLFAAECKASGY